MRRLFAMMHKESLQMIRDPAVIRMIIGVPIIQLFIFGFALNTNPKHLPTLVVNSEPSVYTRKILSQVSRTGYFDLKNAHSFDEAKRAIKHGDALFVLYFPAHFSTQLMRGEKPKMLIEADATDSVATAQALGALQQLLPRVFHGKLGKRFTFLQTSTPFQLITHARYNPEGITRYFIVPGLLGLTITASLLMAVAMSVTKERERGTMESLLSTPLKPFEVLLGKMMPYIVIGYIQIIILIIAAYFLGVPIRGNVLLLLLSSFPFILSNLSIGLLFSIRAENQLQAVTASTFFFLPSILLSGFMFPFQGMPMWAQIIGYCLPMTHYVHITRDIMLKGNGLFMIWPHLWPIIVFSFLVIGISLLCYRTTLD